MNWIKRIFSKSKVDNSWIPIKDSKDIGSAIIKTLHKDGTEDVCKVIDGIIYTYDPKTTSRITHYKIY